MRRLFIMRKDLHMSAGKLAAQVGHCAEAYWTNMLKRNDYPPRCIEEGKEFIGTTVLIPRETYDEYICGAFTKTICEAKNKAHLLKAKDMADELGLLEYIDYGLIYDNCLTELTPEEENGRTLTGIWFCPLPDDVAHTISKKYQLYQED